MLWTSVEILSPTTHFKWVPGRSRERESEAFFPKAKLLETRRKDDVPEVDDCR
jgi:hypothetical protein